VCLFKLGHQNIPINQDIFSPGKSTLISGESTFSPGESTLSPSETTPGFRAFGRNDHNSLYVVYVKGSCEETMFVLKIKTFSFKRF